MFSNTGDSLGGGNKVDRLLASLKNPSVQSIVNKGKEASIVSQPKLSRTERNGLRFWTAIVAKLRHPLVFIPIIGIIITLTVLIDDFFDSYNNLTKKVIALDIEIKNLKDNQIYNNEIGILVNKKFVDFQKYHIFDSMKKNNELAERILILETNNRECNLNCVNPNK